MDKKDIRHYARIGAESFLNDPFYITCFPRESVRRKLLYSLWVMRLTASVNSGDIIVEDPEKRGICIWRSVGKSYTAGDILGCPDMWRMLCHPRCAQRFLKSFSSFGPSCFRPGTLEIEPVFVDPAFQNRGIATKLITEKFPEFDRDNIPLGLVTQSEKNVGFYEKLGFRVVQRTESEGFTCFHMERLPDTATGRPGGFK